MEKSFASFIFPQRTELTDMQEAMQGVENLQTFLLLAFILELDLSAGSSVSIVHLLSLAVLSCTSDW